MRILLVDDNAHALHRLQIAVSVVCPEAELDSHTSPVKALESAREAVPDIAFLDIEMSGMNGLVLGKALKELNPAVSLIYCTGYSEYAVEAYKLHANGYLLKPVSAEDIAGELAALRAPHYMPDKKRFVLQTFGNFELFVDGKLVSFQRSKAKEVLAVLVDNYGASVTADAIADTIWEDGVYDDSRKKQLYTIISSLRKTLEEVGAGDIMVKTSKGYAIDRSKVDCDYYRLLDGDLSVLNNYRGKYMYEYSWAEFSIGRIEALAGESHTGCAR